MRLLLYTGKGGVGKTTTAAATAALAASRGLRTLVLSADPAHSLGDVLGESLCATPRTLAPCLDALEVDARHVVEAHWGQVRRYLVELLRYQGLDDIVAEELALLPGAEELATLVCVEDWAKSGEYDLIVVDCAPTGSTLRLVTLPEVAHGGLKWLLRMQKAAARIVEPLARGVLDAPLPSSEIFAEVDRLFYSTLQKIRRRLLSQETSVRLVLTPETMVIQEARRALTDLCLFQLGGDAVVLNRVLPKEALRERFFRDWAEVQDARHQEVQQGFAPMACLVAELREDEVRGVEALAAHGEEIFGELDPAGRLGESRKMLFEREKGRGRVRIPLPGLGPDTVDVIRVEDELIVGIGSSGRRQKVALPLGFARLEVSHVSYRGDELVVSFVEAGGPKRSASSDPPESKDSPYSGSEGIARVPPA